MDARGGSGRRSRWGQEEMALHYLLKEARGGKARRGKKEATAVWLRRREKEKKRGSL